MLHGCSRYRRRNFKRRYFYVKKINENWTKPFDITNTPGNSFIGKKYGFFSGKLLLAWSEELSESEYEIYYDEIETF